MATAPNEQTALWTRRHRPAARLLPTQVLMHAPCRRLSKLLIDFGRNLGCTTASRGFQPESLGGTQLTGRYIHLNDYILIVEQ